MGPQVTKLKPSSSIELAVLAVSVHSPLVIEHCSKQTLGKADGDTYSLSEKLAAKQCSLTSLPSCSVPFSMSS